MRRAKWRQQPATENQKSFVESRWNKAPRYAQGGVIDDAARSLRIQRLTRGDAANIITRIKHGAMVSVLFDDSHVAELTWRFLQGRYEYKMKAMRKEEQLQLKELRRQAREVVTVGPLAAG